MTAFVILHYRAIDYTRKCVACIKALEGSKHIIIVDNASPDGSGAALKAEYKGDKEVTVLLNKENSGFAKGNNFGVRYSKCKLAPDYTVVLNNDVEITQKDFIARVDQIYKDHPFDVLGPDIVSVFSGIHQSPKRMQGYDLEAVRKKMAYVKRSQNPILMLLSSGEKNSPITWRHVQRRRRAEQHVDSTAAAEGVVLHGSCVIFSKRYIEEHPEPFYCKTFMYFEMEILEWLCRHESKVIRYDPSISVQHYQYMSSRQEFRSVLKQSKFVCKCLMESLKAAEELMLMTEDQRLQAQGSRESLALAEA